MSDRAPDNLVSAWQQQPTSGFRMVPADFASKIRKDARQSRRGFWIFLGFLALAFALTTTRWYSQPDPIRRLAHVVELAGIVFFVGQIVVHRQRVRAARFDVDRTTVPSLASARAYLETCRAFSAGKWRWVGLVVLFPGPPIDIYGQVLTGVIGAAAGWRSLLIWVAMLAAGAFIGRHFRRRAARAYDRLLHELDDIERDTRP